MKGYKIVFIINIVLFLFGTVFSLFYNSHIIFLVIIGVLVISNGTMAAIGFYKATLVSREGELLERIESLEDLNSKLRTARHEALNHIQVINGLIELEEYKEAKNYVEPLFEEIKTMKEAIKTNIQRLDAFLLGEIIKGKNEDIKISLNIKADLKRTMITDIELCRIFKECLENSYLAVKGIENKFIEISTEIDEDYREFSIIFKDNGKEFPKAIKNEMNIIKITKEYKEAKRIGYSFYHSRIALNTLSGFIKYKYKEGNEITLTIPLV